MLPELRQVVPRDLGSRVTIFDKAKDAGLHPENGDIYFQLGKTQEGFRGGTIITIGFRKIQMGTQPVVSRVVAYEKLPQSHVEPELNVPPVQLTNPIMHYE